jgi:hypothetical protein
MAPRPIPPPESEKNADIMLNSGKTRQLLAFLATQQGDPAVRLGEPVNTADTLALKRPQSASKRRTIRSKGSLWI